MAVEVGHLIVACHVLADAQADRVRGRSAILAKIRAEACIRSAAEAFHRAVALNTTLGSDGVARLLGIEDGDTIPEMVFHVASRIPLQRRKGAERSCDGTSEFDRTTFVAALREKWH
ncbi:MAG TPA: hypothetical protein VGL83_03155 [Stellaceae bacterium]|jgi:hypothetical protein